MKYIYQKTKQCTVSLIWAAQRLGGPNYGHLISINLIGSNVGDITVANSVIIRASNL